MEEKERERKKEEEEDLILKVDRKLSGLFNYIYVLLYSME